MSKETARKPETTAISISGEQLKALGKIEEPGCSVEYYPAKTELRFNFPFSFEDKAYAEAKKSVKAAARNLVSLKLTHEVSVYEKGDLEITVKNVSEEDAAKLDLIRAKRWRELSDSKIDLERAETKAIEGVVFNGTESEGDAIFACNDENAFPRELFENIGKFELSWSVGQRDQFTLHKISLQDTLKVIKNSEIGSSFHFDTLSESLNPNLDKGKVAIKHFSYDEATGGLRIMLQGPLSTDFFREDFMKIGLKIEEYNRSKKTSEYREWLEEIGITEKEAKHVKVIDAVSKMLRPSDLLYFYDKTKEMIEKQNRILDFMKRG